jgi:hypothetical protein
VSPGSLHSVFDALGRGDLQLRPIRVRVFSGLLPNAIVQDGRLDWVRLGELANTGAVVCSTELEAAGGTPSPTMKMAVSARDAFEAWAAKWAM